MSDLQLNLSSSLTERLREAANEEATSPDRLAETLIEDQLDGRAASDSADTSDSYLGIKIYVQVLAQLRAETPLREALGTLVRAIEEKRPEMIGSIQLYDRSGGQVRHGAAPNLPDSYNEAIDGVPVGPKAGSCGTAMHAGEVVVTEDVRTDPRWRDYRSLALDHGLKACWSAPIIGSDEQVLGTFAMFYRQPREPRPADRALIENARSLAAVLIEWSRMTEDLRQEQRLLEQTQRLTGAWEIDLGTGTVRWSEEVYRIHEVPQGKEVTIEEGIEFYAPEARPAIRAAFEEAVQEGTHYDLELPIITAKGHRRWVRTVGAPSEWDGGEVVKVAGAFQDITERKRAERKLEEEEKRLRGLAHSIPGVIYQVAVRPDGTYGNNFVSEQARELLGLDPDAEDFYEQFVGRVPASHREPLIRSIDEAADQGCRWEYEMPFEKPGAEQIWLRGISMPDTRAEELVFNGVLLDITDRKRREQNLQRVDRQFRAIFEDPHMLVGILDVDGTLRAVNETALSYVDTSREEVCGRPFWESPWFGTGQAEEVRGWIERAREGEYVHFEIPLRGTAVDRVVEGTVRPVTDQSGEVVALVISDRDVTERNEYERGLIQAKQEAEQASRVKSSLLENMSHEFRTPLAAVLGYADLLAEETVGRARKFAERIREGGTRLQETLEAVLNLAQLEGEGLEIEPREIDVAETIREAAEAQEPKAQRKGLTLRMDGLDGPVRACMDPSAVSRITTHLVRNGIKFTEEGSVEVVLTGGEDTLVLEIRDTGIGISEETRGEIFEPFFQASSGLSREYEGAGLGLTITRHLVEEAGGTIDLDSDEQGTTVTVGLPRDHSGREEQDSSSPVRAGDLDLLPGSLRILLVEDDASMRELVGEMLPDGIDLSVAAGPEEALRKIRDELFDVVLLDINLKAAMNGVDLLGHIRSEADSPVPKAIAMTAYASDGDEEFFRAEGFDGYVAKPFSEEILWKHIIQVLEEARP